MRSKFKDMRNRLVVHYNDGTLLKGYSSDFEPGVETFQLVSEMEKDKGQTYEVKCADLKAIFYVKTYEGKKEYIEKKKFDNIDSYGLLGIKIKVEFPDGEVIRGMSFDYGENFKGFFIMPVDPKGNNQKIYVITDNVTDIKVGDNAD
jgi:hypothetical protein